MVKKKSIKMKRIDPNALDGEAIAAGGQMPALGTWFFGPRRP